MMMIKKITFVLLIAAAGSSFAASIDHTVAKGETLYGIAKKYDVSVMTLSSYNNMSSPKLLVGQKISIPFADSETNVVFNEPIRKSSANSASSAVHIVRRGDTLSGIAARYRVGLTSLTRYNNISSRKPIQAGQKLRIPGSSQIAAQSYTQPRSTPLVSKSTGNLRLESDSAIVVDAETGKVLFSKNVNVVKPIASITKLMTAMVTLDANMALDETLTISDGDVDYLKRTTSRLPLGTKLSRYDMLRLALMSSENRAASALSRHYPGGKTAFIQAMNEKARVLGMYNTSFADATGLTPKNVSTAEDLVKLVEAASQYDLIHKFSTTEGRKVAIRPKSAPLEYKNSNALVRNGQWDIAVSKTGYINEAGRCLVMKAEVAHRPAVMIFLQSNGKYSPVGDATRIKKWIESGGAGVTMASL
jgi:serine-type D-Ala-D-Ala endopeptidase (penicillin-binding protein 7)